MSSVSELTREEILTEESVVTELQKNGYTFIPFSPCPSLITRVVKGWNEFLQIPFADKMKWRLGNPQDPDDGYIPRTIDSKQVPVGTRSYDGKAYDDKDFFHYRPYLPALLDHAKVPYGKHIEWFEAMQDLYEYSLIVLGKEIMKKLDQDIPGINFSKRFTSPIARSRHTLRLLSYKQKLVPGQALGKFHIDRNFGTIQVYESHSALCLDLPQDGGRVPYIPRSNQALFFPSAKAEITTSGLLKGTNHGIVVPEDYSGDQNATRQSIVFFGHIYPETPV